MDPLIPDYSLYTFEEPTLLYGNVHDGDNAIIEIPLIIIPECEQQQQLNDDEQDVDIKNQPPSTQADNINLPSSPISTESISPTTKDDLPNP